MQKMLIDNEIMQLASIFRPYTSLYIVGGAVRNHIMGLPYTDIDIASPLTVEEVKALLVASPFAIVSEYPRTGTLLIKGEGNTLEYTTFRKDSYPYGKGVHRPDEVIFTTDICEDAARRDFKCNAIYYDVCNGNFVDPLGGIKDINHKILSTTVNPSKVLGEDALRIMRLARFVAELDFCISEDALVSATKFCNNLADISRERIADELIKVLNANQKYLLGIPSKGLRLMQSIGILDILGISSIGAFAFKITDTDCLLDTKLTALFMNCDNAENALRDLKLSNRLIRNVTKAITACQFAMKCDEYVEFIVLFYDVYEIAYALLPEKLTSYIDSLSKNNIPTNISKLLVNGDDAINCGYTGPQIKQKLQEILKTSIEQRFTTRDEQLREMKKRDNS